MKKYLILFILLAWASCAQAGSVMMMGGGTPVAGGGYLCGGGTVNCASFSDGFTDLNAWTNETGDDVDWSVTSSQANTGFTGSNQVAFMRYNTATNSISQFQRMLVVNNSSNSSGTAGFTFRVASNSSGYRYDFEKENASTDGACYFNEYNGAAWSRSIATSACSLAEGEYMCVVVQGTTDNAKAYFWRNCANAVPLSSGPHCTTTTAPCWDNAGDTADVVLTGSITNEQDTNKYLGVMGYSGSNGNEAVTIDTWSGGDVPD